MRAPRNLQMTQALAKTLVVILKPQAILLKTAPIGLIYMKKSSWYLPGVFIPMSFNTLHSTKKINEKET